MYIVCLQALMNVAYAHTICDSIWENHIITIDISRNTNLNY